MVPAQMPGSIPGRRNQTETSKFDHGEFKMETILYTTFTICFTVETILVIILT
jgi:hypothetical protein